MCSMTPADDRALAVTDRINVNLDGVFEELVDQDRVLGTGLDGHGHVTIEAGLVVDDFHRAPTKHEAGTDNNRIADSLGDPPRFVITRRRRIGRLFETQAARSPVEIAPDPRPDQLTQGLCQ